MTFEEWLAKTGLDPVDAWWVLALGGAKLPGPAQSDGGVAKDD